MEKRKQIDAESLKSIIKETGYPIGFNFDNAFAHNRAPKSNGGRIVIDHYYLQFGLRVEDLLTLIDDMPSTDDPGGALEDITEKYNELMERYKTIEDAFVRKEVVYLDIKYALDRLEETGITLTSEQFLSLLKSELDNPSYDYENVEDDY